MTTTVVRIGCGLEKAGSRMCQGPVFLLVSEVLPQTELEAMSGKDF